MEKKIIKFKKNQIVKCKENFDKLYRKGDLFKIIKINYDEYLIPIEAMRLKDKQIYGFEFDEFLELKEL